MQKNYHEDIIDGDLFNVISQMSRHFALLMAVPGP